MRGEEGEEEGVEEEEGEDVVAEEGETGGEGTEGERLGGHFWGRVGGGVGMERDVEGGI